MKRLMYYFFTFNCIDCDKVLNEKELDFYYEREMINYFKKQFLSHYSKKDFKNLQLITKSLLFTLIPLHNAAVRAAGRRLPRFF